VGGRNAIIPPAKQYLPVGCYFMTQLLTLKTYLYVLSFICWTPFTSTGQIPNKVDTSKTIYGDLPVLKHYTVSGSSMISADTSWFMINEKSVDSNTYKKFTQPVDNVDKCRPCILLGYDTSENLILKRVSYGDCTVGYWIEYYPNGKVKVIGHFKENMSSNWDNLFNRGYCRQDGVWNYYNKKGQITSSELWKDGKLLKSNKKK